MASSPAPTRTHDLAAHNKPARRHTALITTGDVNTGAERRRAARELRLSEVKSLRAVLNNSGPGTCYVRGDARAPPFGDETFGAVCCFGALYLMLGPFGVAGSRYSPASPGGLQFVTAGKPA